MQGWLTALNQKYELTNADTDYNTPDQQDFFPVCQAHDNGARREDDAS
jgi:hypothetical protein